LGDDYSDRLSRESRSRILEAAQSGIPHAASDLISHRWVKIPQLFAAASLTLVLVLPLLLLERGPVVSPALDLTLAREGNRVVLAWKDDNQPHRVTRLTSRDQLPQIASLPGVTVMGDRWVDTNPDEPQIVFYVVE
jgi:hypothetical protein